MPDTVRVLGLRIEFDTDSLGTATSTPDGKFDMRDGQALGIIIDPPPHNRSFFMSHFEALKYQAVFRHMLITQLSHLFLAEQTERLRVGKAGGNSVPGPHGRQRPDRRAVIAV